MNIKMQVRGAAAIAVTLSATVALAACGSSGGEAQDAGASSGGVTNITVGTSGQLSNVDVYLGMREGTFTNTN